jgi:hypothetical protein
MQECTEHNIQEIQIDNIQGVCGRHNSIEASDYPIIIFVHGNSASSRHWYKHIDFFIERDYSPERLWAIDIEGGITHKNYYENIETFVSTVQDYVGQEEISIVSHSLGVTASRYWMDKFDTYNYIESFIGIAGANHGMLTCPPKAFCEKLPSTSILKPCQTLSKVTLGKSEIERFNDRIGETPGDIDYYTIRGSKDSLYSFNKDSPRLEGANKNVEIDAGHIGAKNESIDRIYNWCS